jgi:hypothetical protein
MADSIASSIIEVPPAGRNMEMLIDEERGHRIKYDGDGVRQSPKPKRPGSTACLKTG